MSPKPSVPWHQSEACFRKYELIIQALITNWPNSVAFDPSPLSVNTYSARLRDAIRAQELNNWKTSMPRDKFLEVAAKIVVSVKDGQVVCYPRGQTLKVTPLDPTFHDNSQNQFLFVLTYEADGLDLLHAAASLLSAKKLSHPIKLLGYPETLLVDLSEKFDISYSREADCFVLL